MLGFILLDRTHDTLKFTGQCISVSLFEQILTDSKIKSPYVISTVTSLLKWKKQQPLNEW